MGGMGIRKPEWVPLVLPPPEADEPAKSLAGRVDGCGTHADVRAPIQRLGVHGYFAPPVLHGIPARAVRITPWLLSPVSGKANMCAGASLCWTASAATTEAGIRHEPDRRSAWVTQATTP